MSGSGVFKVDIQTFYYNNYITNVYHVTAGSLNEAADYGEQIAALHAALLNAGTAQIYVNRVRASTLVPRDNAFVVRAINLRGTRPGLEDVYPPFCRFRVDLNIGPRRPLRKYLLEVRDTDANGDGLLAPAVAYVQANYVSPLVALGVVCSEEGTDIVGGTVSGTVGMRQLRRGSRRRQTPVIP